VRHVGTYEADQPGGHPDGGGWVRMSLLHGADYTGTLAPSSEIDELALVLLRRDRSPGSRRVDQLLFDDPQGGRRAALTPTCASRELGQPGFAVGSNRRGDLGRRQKEAMVPFCRVQPVDTFLGLWRAGARFGNSCRATTRAALARRRRGKRVSRSLLEIWPQRSGRAGPARYRRPQLRVLLIVSRARSVSRRAAGPTHWAASVPAATQDLRPHGIGRACWGRGRGAAGDAPVVVLTASARRLMAQIQEPARRAVLDHVLQSMTPAGRTFAGGAALAEFAATLIVTGPLRPG